jgi:hypothetical protein
MEDFSFRHHLRAAPIARLLRAAAEVSVPQSTRTSRSDRPEAARLFWRGLAVLTTG